MRAWPYSADHHNASASDDLSLGQMSNCARIGGMSHHVTPPGQHEEALPLPRGDPSELHLSVLSWSPLPQTAIRDS